MKKLRIVLVVFIVVLLLGAALGINMYQNRMIWNEEGIVGNSSGNLLNGGFFCEGGDGTIYFCNTYDGGNLYSMDENCENITFVYEDKVENLNYAGNYLVYSRKNYEKETVRGEMFVFNTKGLYGLQLKRKTTKCFYDGTLGLVGLIGNDLFYQHFNKNQGISLYTVRLDGSDNRECGDGAVNPSAIRDGKIYYMGETQPGLFCYDIESENIQKLSDKNYYGCLLAGNYIYTMDLENGYCIVRTDLNGENEEVIVDHMCSAFNASTDGDYIYYQVDDGENQRLECKYIPSGEETVIVDGSYDRIHLVGSWLFFADAMSDQFYMTRINELQNVEAFMP